MKQNRFFILFLLPILLSLSMQLHGLQLHSRQIDSLLHCSFFDTASIAFSVFDPAKGVNLCTYNENKLFHPASNMKVLTSAAALLYLGPDHVVSTEIFFDNAPVNGKAAGNLYIKGGADPDVSLQDLQLLARKIKTAGIKEISGDIVTDVSLFDNNYWGDGWMWDDGSSTDAPFITPLVVNKSEVILSAFVRNGEVIIEVSPDPGYVKILKNIIIDTTKTSRLSFQSGFPGKLDTYTVSGNINPKDTISERLNVIEPERFFAALFRKACIAEGITCSGYISTGNVPASAYSVASMSHTIYEILDDLNKQSRNLSAEFVLRLLASKNKQRNISARDGLRYIDSLILFSGLQPGDYRVADGSGISRYTLLSTKLLSNVLKQLYYQKPAAFDILRIAFPVMGMDGTLRRRMRGTELHGNVYAKTGTLSGVSSLTGSIHTESGRLLIFSIMIQHHAGKLNRCYEVQHQLLQTLYRY